MAARLLATWIRDGVHADRLVQKFETRQAQGKAPWVYDDRRRLRELVFGCVRLKQRYETLLAAHARRGARIRPGVRAILWIALHEIIELGTPEHAAVDQACICTQALEGQRAVGFVNALLRAILRAGVASGFPCEDRDPLGYAQQWLSHPRWLVKRWQQALGTDAMLELCRWNNRRAQLTVRVPPGERDRVRKQWRELSWESEPCALAEDGLRLVTRVPAPLLLQQTEAAVSIQDEAAQLVAPLAARPGAKRVLDLCAAPGGKLAHLAALLPKARICGADVSPARSRRLKDTHARTGLSNVDLVVADGRQPPFAGGQFEVVLLDAPCTGTGVLARRHEARWRRKPADLDSLPSLQRLLLEAAVDAAQPGGIIVYSTCSLEPEENDGVVDRVLAHRADVEEIGVAGDAPGAVCDGLRLRVWPHRHRTDGAFAARLRRRSSV